MKRIISRLEPELPGLEFEYRQYYLKLDIDQVVTGIILWVFANLAFTYSDWLVFEGAPIFFRLFAVRIASFLLSFLVIYLLKKKIRNSGDFDRSILLWSLLTLLGNIAIGLTQPGNFLSGIIVSLVGIFTFYVFIPNPFLVRVIPPVIYTLYSFLAILLADFKVSPAFTEVTISAFLVTNLIGILFSARLYVSRRQEFLARREEERIRAELTRLASTDPLTGVFNRRRLLELSNETFYRFKRYQRPFTILIMDLDGFKNLNDTLGHQQGDSVLIQFAEAVSQEKREADALGRMGGDEFCLVMPETRPQSAVALASRIIQKCAEISPGHGALDVNVTVSIGVSEIRPDDQTLDSLFARADTALYKAKYEGRNCWKIA